MHRTNTDARLSLGRRRFRWVPWLSPRSYGAILVALLVLCISQSPAQAATSVEAAEGTAVSPSVLSALQSEAERETLAIAGALGVNLRETVQIVIAGEISGHRIEISQSYPEASLIIIPPHVLARRIVPLAHELTHVIAGPGADEVLSEGLAAYNQEKFGSDPAFPNLGTPIAVALKEAIITRYGARTWPEAVDKFEMELGSPSPGVILLSRWINDMDNGDNRTLAYLAAASYVGYLMETHLEGDMKAFYGLYRSGDYAQAMLSPEEVWSGWLQALRDS